MKRKFLSLALCAALSACFGFSACGTQNQPSPPPDPIEPVRLSAPVISLSGDTISWDAVEHATGYNVFEGQSLVTRATQPTYTITQALVGTYSYTVTATSTDTEHFVESLPSNAVSYEVKAMPVKLSAPVISLSGSTLSWSAVENATGYEIYEGTSLLQTTTQILHVISQATAGNYSYTVRAISADSAKFSKSDASNAVTYTVQAQPVKLPAGKKIYVVGDSTVCDYSNSPDNYYLQRYGYGTQLFNYFDLTDNAQIVNLALSGRSSLSFLNEANYNTLKTAIGAGDYLIIGFGHNDEKSDDRARYTHPVPDYQTPKAANNAPSFQYTLYQNYIKLAKDKGATPVLCTPIVRYADGGEYIGKSYAHVTADGDYAAAIRKVGADTQTAVVDLTALSAEYYAAHNDEAKYFHAFTTYVGAKPNETPDGMDKTHINKFGAKQIAYWFAVNLPNDCGLKAHVKAGVTAPAKATDYADAINSTYVKPDYSGFNASANTANKLAATTTNGTTADWYKSAMGCLGGNTKASLYSYKYENQKFEIKADGGSKFASTQDGFGAIFVQIDVTKNFTATAKAKVTSAPTTTSNQNAFGLMLRDDIYMNVNNTALTSNFVSASVTGGGKANMSRIVKETLGYGDSMTFNTDVEYELTLTRVGQVVTATVKQGASEVTTTFTDISFVGVDNTKMYLCLFANRGLTVEFSDVTFEITGEAQGA